MVLQADLGAVSKRDGRTVFEIGTHISNNLLSHPEIAYFAFFDILRSERASLVHQATKSSTFAKKWYYSQDDWRFISNLDHPWVMPNPRRHRDERVAPEELAGLVDRHGRPRRFDGLFVTWANPHFDGPPPLSPMLGGVKSSPGNDLDWLIEHVGIGVDGPERSPHWRVTAFVRERSAPAAARVFDSFGLQCTMNEAAGLDAAYAPFARDASERMSEAFNWTVLRLIERNAEIRLPASELNGAAWRRHCRRLLDALTARGWEASGTSQIAASKPLGFASRVHLTFWTRPAGWWINVKVVDPLLLSWQVVEQPGDDAADAENWPIAVAAACDTLRESVVHSFVQLRGPLDGAEGAPLDPARR